MEQQVESGNVAAIRGDVDNNGVIDGLDTDGDGIKDASDLAPMSYGSPNQPAPTATTGGVPNMLTPYSLGMASPSDLIRSGRNQMQYDANNNGVLDAMTDLDYDGIKEPTPPLQVDSQLNFFGGIALIGPTLTSTGSANGTLALATADFLPVSFDASSYLSHGLYPLDPSSVVITPISGAYTSISNSGYVVKVVPQNHTGAPIVFSVTICDTSPYPLCSVLTVTVTPYYLYWVQPTQGSLWYMYIKQVRLSNERMRMRERESLRSCKVPSPLVSDLLAVRV